MSTFFSGTDTDTLLENAANYNFFLSVIVNNAGDTIAKISLQGFIDEPETTNTYRYKFNRGFMEKVIVKEKKVTEVIYIYTCKIEIENSVDEDFKNLLKIKEEKENKIRLSQISSAGTGGYPRTFVNSFHNTDWSGQYQSRTEKPKQKQPVQQSLFNENFPEPSIKDLTTCFLVALILQDDALDFAFTTSYANALTSWEAEVGEEMIKEYSEYVEQIIEEVFEDIFGSEIELNNLRDIKINISVILGDSIPEKAIKPIIEEYLASLKEC